MNDISESIKVSFKVGKAEQILTAEDKSVEFCDEGISLVDYAKSSAGEHSGAITYYVKDAGETNASIVESMGVHWLSFTSPGTIEIEVTAEGGNNYNSASTKFKLTVDEPKYKVEVFSDGIDFSGSGSYESGEMVIINAGARPEGYFFLKWETTSPEVEFENINSAVTSFTMPGYDVKVTAVFEETSAYGIDISTTEPIWFEEAYGYDYVEAHTVTVKNTGRLPTGRLIVSLSTSDPSESRFLLSTASIDNIEVSGSAIFIVTPKTGLDVGTYKASINITGVVGDGLNFSTSVEVSFTVEKAEQELSAKDATIMLEEERVDLRGYATSTAGGQSGYIRYRVVDAGETNASIVEDMGVHWLSFKSPGTIEIEATAEGSNNYKSASTNFKLTVAKDKTITVSEQIGVMYGGIVATVTFPVLTTNFDDGVYPISLSAAPNPIGIYGPTGMIITIENNVATLPIYGGGNTVAGKYDIWLEIDGVKSESFELTISRKEIHETLSFGVMTVSGTRPEPITVNLSNEGERSLALSKPTAKNFEIGEFSSYILEPKGGRVSFSIRPKADLLAGFHEETITVYDFNNGIMTITASITVKANQTLSAANISRSAGLGSIDLTGHASSTAEDKSGNISYSVVNAGTTGATINGNTLAYISAGVATIEVAAEGSEFFNRASRTFTLTVGSSTPAPTPTTPPGNGGGGGGGGAPVNAAYTIRFNSNGGSAVTNAVVTEGDRVPRPADPRREGFLFDGWYSDSGLSTAYSFSAAVTRNLTLYAKWEEIEDARGSEPEAGEGLEDGEVPRGAAEQGNTQLQVQRPGTFEPISPQSRLTDIGQGHWAAEFVSSLVERGVVDGYMQPDGSYLYLPGNEIRRDEFFKLIAASLSLRLEEGFDGSEFSDWDTVAEWAKPYIGAVVKAGFVLGSLEDGKLMINANSNITRQEVVAISVRALCIEVPAGGAPSRGIMDFEDASEWAMDILAFALNYGMINIDEGVCRPIDNAKRDEVAMVLYKMLEYHEGSSLVNVNIIAMPNIRRVEGVYAPSPAELPLPVLNLEGASPRSGSYKPWLHNHMWSDKQAPAQSTAFRASQ